MKRFLTTLALVTLLAPAALAQDFSRYSTYNPEFANTSDPGSAPLLRDRAPRTFIKDNAALANTSDPGSAPLMVDAPPAYRGQPTDAPALADTSDPG